MLVPRSLLPLAERVPAGRVLSTQELAAFRKCPFLMGVPQDIGGQLGRRQLKAAGFYPQIRAQSENMETLLALCVQGVGICFCPDCLIDGTLSTRELKQLLVFRFQQDCVYPIRFGYRRQSYQWGILSQFIADARAAFPQRPRE